MAQVIRFQRTTDNATSPPPATLGRVAGEPAIELGPITRLWMNDGTTERLLLSSSSSDDALGTQNFLMLSGGTMTGPILYSTAPVAGDELVNKTYVDGLIASMTLFQGTWEVAANDPDLIAAGGQNGYFYICVTADPTVPETAPATIPGIGGMTIDNGDLIYYHDGIWMLVKAGNLTETIADTLYVRLDGSTMTGSLILNGNAVNQLGAVPLQQLNAALDNYLPLAGGIMDAGAGIQMGAGYTPTNNLDVATKEYVDAAVGAGFTGVTVDGVSIVGDGLLTPLSVATVDGGTF